jgi:hypothetical protein
MPRLEVLNNDGRNYLAATDRRYDVIISEPSNPWITGVSNLFTLDHFRAARQAMAPGGIFVQWVQLYEINPDNIKTIYRTFAEVFPHVRVFAADAYSSDTIMLGSFEPLALDVGTLERRMNLPALRRAIEPAHAERATDLLARMLFADRGEVLRYAQLEERREQGEWRPMLRATGLEECPQASCRRRPAPLNTDDNARIEFAAPRDLVGFDAFSGYVEVMYGVDWSYGRVEDHLTGLGEGADRIRAMAFLGESLLAAGRPNRAEEVLRRARELRGTDGRPVHVPELARANAVWNEIIASREPTIRLEPPSPGPEVSPDGARLLSETFERARRAVDDGAYGLALETIHGLPASVRDHSGPSLRLLYGYLLYRSSLADGADAHFAEAAEVLESLGHDEPAWCVQHPELHWIIARARFRAGDFALSVRAMGRFIDQAQTPVHGEHELPAVPRDLDEPPESAPPITNAPGESPKENRG